MWNYSISSGRVFRDVTSCRSNTSQGRIGNIHLHNTHMYAKTIILSDCKMVAIHGFGYLNAAQ